MVERKRRRSKAEIERDRRLIADLYLQGWLQAEIGKEIGLAQSTISRDLVALHGEWLKSALIDFDEAKAQEVAKVDALERTYHQAWLRSCEDAETVKQKGKPGDEPGTVRKGQAGDPRFLAGVQWCIEQRCTIFGVYAAVKVHPLRMEVGAPGTDWEAIAEENRRQWAALPDGNEG